MKSGFHGPPDSSPLQASRSDADAHADGVAQRARSDLRGVEVPGPGVLQLGLKRFEQRFEQLDMRIRSTELLRTPR